MGRPKRKPEANESSPAVSKRQKAKREASEQVLAIARTELEPDPHGRYGILSYNYPYDKAGVSMENQVKHLRERVRSLEIYVRNSIRTADWLEGDFFEWDVVMPHHFPQEFGDVFHATWSFAAGFAIEDITGLSKKQKDQIVASLEGWMVQEDLDSIHARLQPPQQDRFGRALFEALLNKAVVEILFRHPFWYLDETADDAGSHDDTAWDGVSPLGARLDTLLSKFEKVGMEYAQVWRSITTRLANSVEYGQTRDFALGKAMKARRDAKCKALAAHLLSNEALVSLLKPIDDPSQRLGVLTADLQQISQSAVDMIAQIPRLNFHTLTDIGESFLGSKTLRVDYLCTPKDGHRVLGLTRPYVFRTFNPETVEEEVETVAQAVAFIEDESPDAEPSGRAGAMGKGKRAKKPKA
ncbi:uncharacterized protein DSM5745_09346 [Aspergillus mulundensis]|uniref:Uncharacterized protein n=1 Tax=Aspergillus mulundensis TaxID=1810919 RepID=A0A3D8R0M5_9EURO|nr:hypothetical protein DSM5745_09346 [Aspergillus mulundensis]RDW67480.1 hypothetical protein DSM5745_09346 [Aspergillus mulundensis]